MRARSILPIALTTVLLAAGVAVVGAGADTFEVVSIKPTVPGSPGGPGPFVQTEPGMLRARGTLRFLIQYAYGLQDFQITGGPAWTGTERYDVTATQPRDSASFKLLPVMLQHSLADRFQLTATYGTREAAGFALVVAGRDGPRLAVSGAADVEESRGRVGQLTSTRTTMPQLASFLARGTGRPVVDRTGLEGAYNVTLTWTPDALDPNGVSIYTALQEQLGLKLEAARVPVDVLVIERAERPAAN